MEFMSLALAIRYGTPVLLFALVVLVVYLLIMVRGMSRSITDIKDGIICADTLKEIHKGIDEKLEAIEKRTDRLEKKVFNGR